VKIPVLATVQACIKQTFKTKQHFKVFQATTVAHKPYKHEAKLKIGRYIENTKNPSFLTLSGAKKRKHNGSRIRGEHCKSNKCRKLEKQIHKG